MKKFLLPEAGQFYKANLHTHTTCSDGKRTPEEVRELYKRHGYSIVAFTDHDVFLTHNDLKQEDFLPLNGYEMEFDRHEATYEDTATCHICLVALDETMTRPVCWSRDYLFAGAIAHADEVDFDPALPPFKREYSPECVNTVFREGRAHNFFVTYNHPTWSCEDYSTYSRYEGMDAMELVNYSCMMGGYPEYNARVYDDLLRQGKRLYAIYADDCHCGREEDDPRFDACGGWIMIKAGKLDYKSVAAALKNGDFYASCGPELYSLICEDGKISLTCSPCERIILTTAHRRAEMRVDPEGKLTAVEGAEAFSVKKGDRYVRLTLVDKNGRTADTNAYFEDELL